MTPARRPKSLLVGTETSDDAAVWKLDAKRGLVATVDFFAPVVDDPRDYGHIAAANSLSDVYAMGGTPLYALNIVGWPRSQPFELLGEILAGGAEVARKADCPIVGGHSVDDLEPKYGLAVTGLVHPKRVLSNAGANISMRDRIFTVSASLLIRCSPARLLLPERPPQSFARITRVRLRRFDN